MKVAVTQAVVVTKTRGGQVRTARRGQVIDVHQDQAGRPGLEIVKPPRRRRSEPTEEE